MTMRPLRMRLAHAPRLCTVFVGFFLISISVASTHRCPWVTHIPLATASTYEIDGGSCFELDVQRHAGETNYLWFKDGQLIPGERANALVRSNATPDINGLYYLVAQSAHGQATSATARIVVIPIRIQNPPELAAVCQGMATQIWAGAESPEQPSIQWFRDGLPIAGATNIFFTLANARLTNAGAHYFIASNSYGMATSSVMFVTVSPQFLVDIVDGNTDPLEGDTVILAVRGDFAPRTIQWQRDGKAIHGQSASVLVLANVNARVKGRYAAVIAEPAGTFTSEEVSLAVSTDKPDFSTKPDDPIVAYEGDLLVLAARARGSSHLRYDWSFNEHAIRGATKQSLLLPSVAIEDAGDYTVRVQGPTGSDTAGSALAVLETTAYDLWRWRLPQPQGRRLKAIAWGNGRYVAVGHSGTLLISEDAVAWQDVSIPTAIDFEGVAYGNGTFIAVGGKLVVRSTDGHTWTPSASPNAKTLRKIKFGKGVFAATGDDAEVYITRNGSQWHAYPLPVRSPVIAYGPMGYVAAGQGIDDVAPKFLQSRDGIHWTTSTVLNRGQYTRATSVQALCYAGGVYAAMTRDGAMFTSTNTVTWQQRCSPNRYRITDIAAGTNGFVITCDGPPSKILASKNGEAWTLCETLTGHESEAVIYAGGKYVAIGAGGTIATSPDGYQWAPKVANYFAYHGAAEGQNQYVIVGDHGTILSSSDGQGWALQSSPANNDLRDVCYADGLYVAVGHGGAILISENGMEWLQIDSPFGSNLKRVVYAGGVWMLVGDQNACAVSMDGQVWEPLWVSDEAVNLEGITYSGNTWAAAGSFLRETGTFSAILTSSNLVKWTSRSISSTAPLHDIAYGDGLFVAVGSSGTVCISSTLTNWLTFSLGKPHLERILYANGRFVTAGLDGTCASLPNVQDVDSWIMHRTPTGENLHGLLGTSQRTLIAVGNNGAILESLSAPGP